MKKYYYIIITVLVVIFLLFGMWEWHFKWLFVSINDIPDYQEDMEPSNEYTEIIKQEVPFVVQAPNLQWTDPKFQDACEEATMVMANAWVKNQNSLSKEEAEGEIRKLFSYEKNVLGSHIDASITDTAKVFQEFYNYSDVEVRDGVVVNDLYEILSHDNAIIIAPVNGNVLKNPHYSGEGPERHMVVITGYDKSKKEFITNDPGISKGKDYIYKEDVLFAAIRDYGTGNREKIGDGGKNIMIVKK